MAEIYFDVDAALSEVPVNIFPLTDDTDFKTRETGITYNQAGMDLVWNFVTTAGAYTQTAVTPTTGGAYDWAHQGDGMYSIEIPASGGASINNDTEGFGWFTGMATGVLPWRSPVFGFRAAGINNKLIDDAYDTARGLAGTALPAAAADAAGGLPISDAGALDLDTLLTRLDAAISTRLASAGYTAPANSDIATILSRIIGTLATGTHNPQSGDAFSRIGAAGEGLTAIGDTRIANLDVTVSSRSTLTAQQVWEYTTRTLSSFGSLVSDVATAVWGAVARTITGGTITTNSDKTGYTLTGADLADIKAKTDQLTFTTPGSVDATATVDTSDLATSANQTTIINHLTDVKGATFSGSTDSLEAIRNRGDVAWITGGTGGGSNAVTINVKDDNAANVVDCYVEVWDSAGTSFISRTNTNSSGNVTFNLDSNTYTVRIHKTGYYFANQTLTVDGVESVAYTGTILTPTAPTDPTQCHVYGYYSGLDNSAFPAIKSLINLSTSYYEASKNNYKVGSVNGVYNTTTKELYFEVAQGADCILEIPFANIKKRFTATGTLLKISDII